MQLARGGAVLAVALFVAPPTGGAQEEPPWGIEIGGIRFQPSAEVRARGETRIDPYTADGDDLHFVTLRTRIGLEARVDPVRAFLQLQDARDFGATPAGTDGGTTGIHQGYFELFWDRLWLRIGRQEVSYGRERMIGSFGWSSAARSFDAVRLHATFAPVEVDVLAAYVRAQRLIDGDLSEGDFLAALYFTWKPIEQLTVEPYLLYRHDGPTEPPPGTMDPAPWLERERDIVNYGLRVSTALGQGFHAEAEGAVQIGEVGDEEHHAYGAAVELGQRAGMFDATGGVTWATGRSPDGDIDELDNFYPTNRRFFGVASLFGWRNVIEGHLIPSLHFEDPAVLDVALGWRVFALAEPSARWSDGPGQTMGQADNDARFLGHELDAELMVRPIDRFSLSAGYALFVPGNAAEALGHPDPTHFAYVMAGVLF